MQTLAALSPKRGRVGQLLALARCKKFANPVRRGSELADDGCPDELAGGAHRPPFWEPCRRLEHRGPHTSRSMTSTVLGDAQKVDVYGEGTKGRSAAGGSGFTDMGRPAIGMHEKYGKGPKGAEMA